MLRFRYFSVSMLAVGLMASAGWGAYSTSFESGEGFATGSLNGKDSWTGSSSTPVTTAQHSDGTQSVKIGSTQSTVGITRIFTLAEAPRSDPTLLFDFYPTGGDADKPTAWFYVFAGNDDNSVNGRVNFTLNNAKTTAGSKPTLSWTPAGGTSSTVSLSDNAWSINHWNTMTATFSASSQTFDFSINGDVIATGLGISASPLASAATHVSRFWAFNNGYGDFYVDNVRLVPEPASVALVGFAAAGLLLRRRRKRRLD